MFKSLLLAVLLAVLALAGLSFVSTVVLGFAGSIPVREAVVLIYVLPVFGIVFGCMFFFVESY